MTRTSVTYPDSGPSMVLEHELEPDHMRPGWRCRLCDLWCVDEMLALVERDECVARKRRKVLLLR